MEDTTNNWYFPVEKRLHDHPLPPIELIHPIIDDIVEIDKRKDELIHIGMTEISQVEYHIRLCRAQLCLRAMLKKMLGGEITDADFDAYHMRNPVV